MKFSVSCIEETLNAILNGYNIVSEKECRIKLLYNCHRQCQTVRQSIPTPANKVETEYRHSRETVEESWNKEEAVSRCNLPEHLH